MTFGVSMQQHLNKLKMKAFVNKFLKPKVSSEREVAQKKLFDHFVTLLTSAMLDGGKEACFSLAELYYYGNGYDILPNPDIGDLAMLIGKQLGNKECLEAELKNPENSENMKEVVSDIMNDIAENEEISDITEDEEISDIAENEEVSDITEDEELDDLINALNELHLCYEGLKLVAPYPVDSDINEGWEVIDYKTSDEKEISSFMSQS